jgi:hypothetical protein
MHGVETELGEPEAGLQSCNHGARFALRRAGEDPISLAHMTLVRLMFSEPSRRGFLGAPRVVDVRKGASFFDQ